MVLIFELLDNIKDKLKDYESLKKIKSSCDKVSIARKLFEFYFLTPKFDLDLAILLKNNPKKTFTHPFEVLFINHWLKDPFLFALAHILALESPSANLTEMSLFHLFYTQVRIQKLGDKATNKKFDWEMEFNLNSFVKVTQNPKNDEKTKKIEKFFVAKFCSK